MILNRCLYDALNFILDEFRPFGNRGLPGICVRKVNEAVPSEKSIVRKMEKKVEHLLLIKMGFLGQC